MPRIFSITPSATSVPLDVTGRGTVSFTVSNVSARAIKSQIIVKPGNAGDASMFQIKEGAERTLAPQSTANLEVAIAAGKSAAAGPHTFLLKVVDIDQPDDNYEESASVSFNVAPVKEGGFPWWIVIAAAMLLVAGGVLWYVLSPHGIPVKDYTSQPYATVAGELKGEGLNPEVGSEDTSSALPVGAIVDQSPKTGTLKKGGTITFVVKANPPTPAPTPAPTQDATPPTPAAEVPNFAGSWVEINPKDPAHPMHLEFQQTGNQVRMGNDQVLITNEGNIVDQKFYAQQGKRAVRVQTEAEAAEVITITLSLDASGAILTMAESIVVKAPMFTLPKGTTAIAVSFQRGEAPPTPQPKVPKLPAVANMPRCDALKLLAKEGFPPPEVRFLSVPNAVAPDSVLGLVQEPGQERLIMNVKRSNGPVARCQ